MHRRVHILLLLNLILAGGILRLYKLNYQSLWYDEIHTVLRSLPANSIGSILGYAENSEVDQPPVFFLYTYFSFKILGVSETTVRLGSALLGILAIPVMYFLGREFKDSESGIFAAALTAVNYFHIYYSQEARFYTMTFLLTALSYLFFVRAVKYVRGVDFVLYGVFIILLLYTHYFGMVIFATQVLTFLVLAILYRRSDRKFVVLGLVTGVIVMISFLPWVPVILKHSEVGSFWIQKPTLLFMLEYFYNYFGKDIVQTLVLAGLIFLFIRHSLKKEYSETKTRQLYIVVVFWLIISYAIPFVRSVTATPIMHIRYTIITVPAWIIIFSLGWATLKSKKWRHGLLIFLIVISVANLVIFRKHYSKIQKQQMREVALLVQQKKDAGVPVYSVFAEHYQFYFNKGDTIHFSDPGQMTDIERFWLLQAEFFSSDELTQELDQYLDTFEIAENHQFHKTAAVLLVRKAAK